MGGSRLSLEEYGELCAGQPYRALVEYHVVRHDPDELEHRVRSTFSVLLSDVPEAAVTGLYNKWNFLGQDESVMRQDCGEVLQLITEDARKILSAGDLRPDDERLLRTFRLVTLGLALTASLFDEVRWRMGIHNAPELSAYLGR